MSIPSSTTFMRTVIENGLLWRMAAEFTVPAGSTYYLGFITSASTVAIEARDAASSRNDTTISLYEDSAYTGGTAITLQNRNRQKQSETSLLPFTDVKQGVTAAPVGTPVATTHILVGNAGGVSNVPSDPDTTVILLKPSTSYVVSFLNSDVLPAVVGFGASVRKDVFIA